MPLASTHAVSAGRTRLEISTPRSRSMTAMSYWLARSSQNWGRFPKYRPDGRICSNRPASIEYVGDGARWYAEVEFKPTCAELARL